jgi:hypothetical protein
MGFRPGQAKAPSVGISGGGGTTPHLMGGAKHLADTIVNIKTKVSPGSLYTTDPNEIAVTTAKPAPVAADMILIEDSADSNKKKMTTFGYLTGLYVSLQAATPGSAQSGNINISGTILSHLTKSVTLNASDPSATGYPQLIVASDIGSYFFTVYGSTSIGTLNKNWLTLADGPTGNARMVLDPSGNLSLGGTVGASGAGSYLQVTSTGIGIGLTNMSSPAAALHIKAGTNAAGTAPLKFTSGVSLGTPEAGSVEFTTDDLYFTITTAAARKGIVLNDGSNLTSARVPFATTNGRLTDSANMTFVSETLSVTRATNAFTSQVKASNSSNAGAAVITVESDSGKYQIAAHGSALGAGYFPTCLITATTGGQVLFILQPNGDAGLGGNILSNSLNGSALQIHNAGRLGIGLATLSSVSAILHLKAGTASSGTSPLKFNSGTSMTLPEAGAMEFTTDNLYFTITTAAARKNVTLDEGLTSTRVPFATTNGRLTDSANMTFAGETLLITRSSILSSSQLRIQSTSTTGTADMSIESDTGKFFFAINGSAAAAMYLPNDLIILNGNTAAVVFAVDGSNNVGIGGNITGPTFAGSYLNLQSTGISTALSITSPLIISTRNTTASSSQMKAENINVLGTAVLSVESDTGKYAFAVNGSSNIAAYQPNNLLIINLVSGAINFSLTATNSIGIGGNINNSTLAGAAMFISASGFVGIGLANLAAVSAVMHLKAGTTAAGTAPLKFTSGTSLTIAEAGTMEFTTDNLYFTITTAAARKNVTLDEGLTSTRVPFVTTNGRLTDSANMLFSATTGITVKGYAGNVRSETDSCTEAANDELIVMNKGTAATVTLLAATGSGRQRIVKNIGAGTVTVDAATNGGTIDGSGTIPLIQWDSAILIDYGVNLWVAVYC